MKIKVNTNTKFTKERADLFSQCLYNIFGLTATIDASDDNWVVIDFPGAINGDSGAVTAQHDVEPSYEIAYTSVSTTHSYHYETNGKKQEENPVTTITVGVIIDVIPTDVIPFITEIVNKAKEQAAQIDVIENSTVKVAIELQYKGLSRTIYDVAEVPADAEAFRYWIANSDKEIDDNDQSDDIQWWHPVCKKRPNIFSSFSKWPF